MADETTPTDSSSVNATINAVAGLAQAIPVYQDALQPAAKEVGKSLEVVAKAVGIALAPLKGLVWGYERIEAFISESVGKRLKNVPPEDIITPAANVVGPAVEALKFSGEDINLRELYANLIANAMDRKTSEKTHPAFVDIIKSLTSVEALVLNYFAKANLYTVAIVDVLFQEKGSKISKIIFRNLTIIGKRLGLSDAQQALLPGCIDNLCRLGILELLERHLPEREQYDEIWSGLATFKEGLELEYPDRELIYAGRVISQTDFGDMFIESVVAEKN